MFSTDVFEGTEMYGELLQTNIEDTALLAYFEEGLIFSDFHMGIRAPSGLKEVGGSFPIAECPGVQHRTETHETFLSASINSDNNVTSPRENIFLFHRLK